MIAQKLDIPTLIKFLSGNYTGEYWEITGTLADLKTYNCDPQIIQDLEQTLNTGYPNKYNASTTHEHSRTYFRYGNHSSIDKNWQQSHSKS